jgi:hypothetical protein
MAASVAVTCGLHFNKAHAVGTLPRHAPHPDVWTTGCFAGTHAVMCSNTFATIDRASLFRTIPLNLTQNFLSEHSLCLRAAPATTEHLRSRLLTRVGEMR